MEPLVVVPGQIDVTVLPGRLVVCHAPTSNIPGAGWMVARTLLFNEERSCFNAVILDDEGCTMVMDEERAADAKRAGLGPFLSVADDRFWTAIHVQLGQSANDVPGLISHMAKALMRASISILHYSTYGTEIFLVQEKDYEEALACFKSEDLQRKLSALMRSRGTRDVPDAPEPHHVCPPSPGQEPAIRKYAPGDGSYSLAELDQSLFIVRLKREYFHDVAHTLLHLFLYDSQHYHAGLLQDDMAEASPVKAGSDGARTTDESMPDAVEMPNGEQSMPGGGQRRPEQDPMRFVVAYMESGDEITLYLDVDDLHLFPSEAIEICPTPWRGIKLLGRAFKFDETGVVSAMSKVSASDNVSILSLSTYRTTITMVEQSQVEDTLKTMSAYLEARVRRSEVPQVDMAQLRF